MGWWCGERREGYWKIVQGERGAEDERKPVGEMLFLNQKPIDKRYAEGLIMLHHHGPFV